MRRLLLLALLAACVPHRPATSEAPRSETIEVSPQLATFDYAWQRLADHYPYPDFKGLDWGAVRAELRPVAIAARNNEELRPVLQDMLSRLGESHCAVIPAATFARVDPNRPVAAAPATGSAGLDVRWMDGDLVISRVDADARLAGVRPGEVVLGVGDRDLATTLADRGEVDLHLWQYMARSAAVSWLDGPVGTRAAVRLRGLDGSERTAELERRDAGAALTQLGSLRAIPVTFRSERLADGRVGYVGFDAFMLPVPQRMQEAMRDFVHDAVHGVVLDLRGNPGGVVGLIMGLAGHFIAEPDQSLGTMIQRLATLKFVAIPKVAAERFSGPVAILIDELSASTSEVMAAGLQKLGRARVFGSVSMGAALPSTFEKLPNGDLLQYVIADLTDPSGARIEGVGVIPDVLAPLTREALAADRDPALEAAVAWLLEEAP